MPKSTIFGVKLKQRTQSSPKFQEVLSKYGCNIKTRIGLHHVTDNVCSPEGVIIIEAIGNEKDIAEFEKDLINLPETEIQKMVFEVE
jgi:imidazoleglycerol phosphate dehydratase HisB